MKEISHLASAARQARERVIKTVSGWSAEQAAFKPDPDTWSAQEILEHLYGTEFFVYSTLWMGLEGLKVNQPIWQGEHTNRGLPTEVAAAEYQAGKFKVPQGGEPKLGGSLHFWIGAFSSCQTILERLGAALKEINQELIFPHFVAGPLDAKQWIEMLTLHMDRHRLQIERLRTANGFPQHVRQATT